ncbi:SBBP repeat-containing protein [Myxococcota bacterium]|nr:SBBP repeat-containing protein [Myxococcota bacterium]MBU1538042.1 SBBP repeat-containing protein [Myxococcota bacterium]
MLKRFVLVVAGCLLMLSGGCDTGGGATAPIEDCGDGRVDGSEQCDGVNLDLAVCEDFGVAGGALRCDEGCRFDLRGCYDVTQFGTGGEDEATGIAVDSGGNIYVVGSASGMLEEGFRVESDWLLAKYDSTGTLLWRRQGGSSAKDYGRGVAVSPEGLIYITGTTLGALADNDSLGGSDGFLIAFSDDGILRWQRQFGTPGEEESNGVALLGDGSVVVAGSTTGVISGANEGGVDIFLVGYSENGTPVWSQQMGSPGDDAALSVAVTGEDSIVIAGYAGGSLGGEPYMDGADMFLGCFGAWGDVRWVRMWGNYSQDVANAVRVRGEQIFVAGTSDRGIDNNPSEKEWDAVLSTFSLQGEKLWTAQWGSKQSDIAFDVGFDDAGGIYVVGSTDGPIEGASVYGLDDIFLSKLDGEGKVLWNRQWGTNNVDRPWGVAIVDQVAYIAGFTYFMIDGVTHFGYKDAFMLRTPVPR